MNVAKLLVHVLEILENVIFFSVIAYSVIDSFL